MHISIKDYSLQNIIFVHNFVLSILIFVFLFVFIYLLLTIWWFEKKRAWTRMRYELSYSFLKKREEKKKKYLEKEKKKKYLENITFLKKALINNKILNIYKYLNFTHNIKLEIIWTIIPIFFILEMIFPSLSLLADDEIDHNGSIYTVSVIGNQWYWNYELNLAIGVIKYVSNLLLLEENNNEHKNLNRLLTTIKSLPIAVGIKTSFYITSNDVAHSWALPSLGIKVDAIPGRINLKTIIATRLGLYSGMCSELCGVEHGFMPISVQVLTFNDWWFNIKDMLDSTNKSTNKNTFIDDILYVFTNTVQDIVEDSIQNKLDYECYECVHNNQKNIMNNNTNKNFYYKNYFNKIIFINKNFYLYYNDAKKLEIKKEDLIKERKERKVIEDLKREEEKMGELEKEDIKRRAEKRKAERKKAEELKDIKREVITTKEIKEIKEIKIKEEWKKAEELKDVKKKAERKKAEELKDIKREVITTKEIKEFKIKERMKKEKVDAIINKLYDIQKRGNDNKKNIVELEKEKIILKKEIEELNEKRNILISEIKIKTAEVIEQEATLRIPVRIYMQNLKLFEQNLLGELEKKKLLVEKDRLEKDIDVKDKNIKKVKKKQKDLLELESLINKKVNLGVNKEKIIISLEKEEIKIKKEKEELEKEIIKEKEVLLHRLHPKALQEKKNKKNAIGLMLSINLKENCKDIKKIKPKELEKISNWIGAKISKKVYGNILLYKDLSKKEYLEIKDSTEKHLVFILNKNTVEELKDLSKRVGNEVDVINMLKYLEYVKKNQSIKKKIKDK